MKQLIGFIFIIGSIILSAYVGIWVMFIQPIIYACQMFDAGTLTGMIVGITILKCIFASTVSGLILVIGYSIGKILLK